MKLDFASFSPSSKKMLGVVGLTLVVFICSGFSLDCFDDPCEEKTKADRYPFSWVSCIDGKPMEMRYYENFAIPTGAALNPADWDCSHPNSPAYKGSASPAPLTAPPSGPVVVHPGPDTTSQGKQANEKDRAALAMVAYLPPLFRDLPFLPKVPDPSSSVCDPSQPDVFQTIHTGAKVTRIGTCPFRVKATIEVPTRPLQVAITPDGSTALVTSFDNAVSFIDLATNKVVFTLNTEFDINPHGLAIAADGTQAYITSPGSRAVVQVIDLTTRKVTSTFPVGLQFPTGATLTPDGAQLWITGPLDIVAEVYDVASGTLLARVNAGFTTDVAFNSTGTRAYITSQTAQPGTVVVVDTATLLPIKSYTVGRGPADIAMTYGDQALIVNNELDGSVSVIDLIDEKVTTMKLGSVISGISIVR